MGNDLNAARKRIEDRILAKIDDTGDEKLFFPDYQLELTKISAEEVRKRLLSHGQDLSLPELFQLYHYAKQLERNTHCSMTDVYYFEPLNDAYRIQRLIDRKDTKAIESLPLLGYVLSIKEYIPIKGTDCTWGFHHQVDNPVNYTAGIVLHLKSKGALIACKGNVPQCLMAIESNNWMFGESQNPIDPTRTSGGSSGGDAATVGLGLTNAAIGTDIGGSIRIPSLFCGIWGFKPTAGRFDENYCADLFHNHPFDGLAGEDQMVIKTAYGPMARSAYDCTAITKVICDYSLSTWESPPLEWRAASRPKRVGFIPEMTEFYKLPDCCTRVFHEAKSILERAGCELVEVNISHLIYDIALNTYAAFFSSKALEEVFLGDTPITEPFIESYNQMIGFMKLSVPALKSLRTSSLMSVHSKFMIDAMLKARTHNNVSIMREKIRLIDAVIAEYKRAGVDVALAYGLFPAPRLNETEDLTYIIFYTCMWNFLNFPTGAVPVGKVRESEQYYDGRVGDRIDICMEKTMQGSAGMPIGVQVVGLPWMDEVVLATMETMEDEMTRKD